MPTDVIKKVGATNTPTTMDYSSVQAWEDACPSDLTAVDQRWIGECYNQGTLSYLTASGTTTDATRYLWLRAAAGASFRDHVDVRTNPLFYDKTKGIALEVANNYGHLVNHSTPYTRYTGLQFANLGAAGAFNHDQDFIAEACIFQSGVRAVAGNSFGAIYINCLIVDKGTYGASSGPVIGHLYNCTVVQVGSGAGYGCQGNNYGATRDHHNSAFFGFQYLTFGANGGTSDYAATDATANLEGAHTLSGLTYASQFVNPASDFRALETGQLKAGTPDPTNAPTDISGFTRDTTTPYIGCWEAGVPPPPFAPSRGIIVMPM